MGRYIRLLLMALAAALAVTGIWAASAYNAAPADFAASLRQALLPGLDAPHLPLIPLVSLLLLVWFWRRHGQDPPMPAIIPRFDPPGSATPGLVRAVRRMAWDEICLVADILNLAVKGHLEITSGDGPVSYVLRRIPVDSGSFLHKDEQDLLDLLLPGPESILPLHSSSHDILSAAHALSRDRCASSLKKLNAKNTVWLLLGLLPLPLLLFAVHLRSGAAATAACAGVYALGAILTGIVCKRTRDMASSRKKSSAIGIAATLIASLAVSALFASILAVELTHPPEGWLGLGWLGLLLAVIFGGLMPRRTEAAVRIAAEIEGFARYLGSAEQNSLERFERLLPYALALDVAEAWAGRFDACLQAASMPPPRCIAFAAADCGWPRSFNRTMRTLGRICTTRAKPFHALPAARQARSRSPGGSGRRNRIN